ncbi:MAG: hydrogenase 4 subunit B [Candidatus Omnitrophica bacterium]|nr:hydrogenase 4 subunit B [Candidatus Omnitrophota bacterium]
MIDPIAVFFLAVIGIVSVPSLIFSAGYLRVEPLNTKLTAWALSSIFIISMCLVVTSGNLFSFLIFWELMSLSSYFLVVFDYKHEKSIRAGTIYMVMTHAGTACIMAAFLILYKHAYSFDYHAVKEAFTVLNPYTKNTVFLLLFTGFAVKAGVVPLHIWLPYAHPQAPSYISSIMSGVMIKVALYGMIRFFINILGPGPAWWGALIIVSGMVSCMVGIIYALMESDIKKLLAYSSVENMGIILLGVGTAILFYGLGVMPVAVLGMCAGLYHIVNHALFKGLLFLSSGSIYKETGLRDMEKMGGLIKGMPVTAMLFLIGAMGISAIPPFNGFVSELVTFKALFSAILQSGGAMKVFMISAASVLALTSALAAACFIKAFGITFLAMPRSKRAEEAREASFSMKAGPLLMAFGVVVFGVLASSVAPVLSGISSHIFGTSQAGFTLGPVSRLPAIIAIILLAVVSAAVIWLRLVHRREKTLSEVWDCGYYEIDNRNEYTATAFSKPFRIAFGFFLLPYRKSEKIRDSFYHIRKFTYETHTTPVFKNYFYEPLVRAVYVVALKLRRLQPGSIHLYIAYIFITLVSLLALASIF